MRIPVACLLLLFAAVLAQDASVSPRYRKFIEQHIYGGMRAEECSSVILKRRISKTDSNECKETNTFIRANTNQIRSICGAAGEPYGEMTKSLQPFDIVVCKLRNQEARHPRCEYRGQARTRRIAIKCEQGFPVHFDRDIVHFDNWLNSSCVLQCLHNKMHLTAYSHVYFLIHSCSIIGNVVVNNIGNKIIYNVYSSTGHWPFYF